MHTINTFKFKRDCFLALLLPTLIIGVIQIIVSQVNSFLWAAGLGLTATLSVAWALSQFLNRLENTAWHEQLSDVIKNVTSPVIVANEYHEISFINDNFKRLPLYKIISHYKRLPELLSAKTSVRTLSERCKHIAQSEEVLDALSSRLKLPFQYKGNTYELVLLPLISPSGKRWGTLIECFPKSDEESELENKINTIQQERNILENELKVFTATVSKLHLYHQDPQWLMDSFGTDKYHHPLVKNASKLIMQLAFSLKRIQTDLDTEKGNIEQGIQEVDAMRALILQVQKTAQETIQSSLVMPEVVTLLAHSLHELSKDNKAMCCYRDELYDLIVALTKQKQEWLQVMNSLSIRALHKEQIRDNNRFDRMILSTSEPEKWSIMAP